MLSYKNTDMFHKEYAAVFDGDESWQAIQIPKVKLTNGLMTRPIFVIRRSLKVLVSHQNQSRILNRHVFWQCLVTR